MKVSEIDILSASEKEQQLYTFNCKDNGNPPEMTVYELFAEQVKQTPDQTALVYQHRNMTYLDLDNKAGHLARELVEKGTTRDKIIGVILDRTLDMVLGILAVLKAGGAYLPIDPESPLLRTAHLLEDSQSSLVLTTKEVSTQYLQGHSFSREVVMTDMYHLIKKPGATLKNINHPGDLAYIIYTSGSTGNPKGVMVQHSNVVNVVSWFARQYLVQIGVNVMQMSDYTFDASVNQIFAPLLNGGTLHIIGKETQTDFAALRLYIEKNHVEIINFVPLFLYELFRDEKRLETIRVVLAGGEPLADTVKDVLINLGYELYNQYGPTETTIDALTAKCTKAKVNLGKPIANTCCFILNGYGALLPLGTPGELYIGGAGLTRGYLNQPELTANKFYLLTNFLQGHLLQKTMNQKQTVKLYNTGDMVRWLPDGSIEFLGRKDNQVKIRGFRMELGEIENQLLKYNRIKEAFVLVKEHKNGDKYLCAYIVKKGEIGKNKESNFDQEIKEFLTQRLPVYMIPTCYIKLEKVPLTSTGKVDRKALPEPEPETINEYIAPRNEMERAIICLLSEVLGIDTAEISVRANLFDIGVNSISLIKIVNRISTEFNTHLSITTLFVNPMVEGIVTNMRKNLIPINSKRLVLLNRGKASRNLFILTGDGAIYCMKGLAKLLEDHYNVYGIQAWGIMEPGPLPKNRSKILEEYLKEIKMIQPQGPYWVSGHCVGAVVAYELGRLLEDRKDQVKVVVLDVNAFIPEKLLDNYKYYRAKYLLRKFYRKIKFKLKNMKKLEAAPAKIEKTNILPEDLEARRKEVEKNLARLFDIYMEIPRIINSPILVFKAVDTSNWDSPRWHPRVWSKMSTQPVELLPTPGDHYSMFDPPHVTTLARLMIENM
jgi:amino acid adenylation domain-containing protein